jgi:putative flavoprotein involved in K+ transport
VETAEGTLIADQVVVATGPFQTPRVAPIAAELDPGIAQLHSSEYRNPAQIPAGPVLVVGGGNTGHQIATELAATHEVHLAVGSRQTPLPRRLLGRDVFELLTRLGAMRRTADSWLGRRLRDREVLIGSSPRRARRHGIRLHPRAVAAADGSIAFADGATLSPGTVIWATGFGTDHSWIDVPVFGRDGELLHRRGVTASPGLYVLGLPWLHTRGSALLGWVKGDAEHLAGHIAAAAPRLRVPATGPRLMSVGPARATLQP